MKNGITADDLREVIAYKEKSFAALLLAHGDGVRPSWVSAELALIGASLNRLEAQLKEVAT